MVQQRSPNNTWQKLLQGILLSVVGLTIFAFARQVYVNTLDFHDFKIELKTRLELLEKHVAQMDEHRSEDLPRGRSKEWPRP